MGGRGGERVGPGAVLIPTANFVARRRLMRKKERERGRWGEGEGRGVDIVVFAAWIYHNKNIISVYVYLFCPEMGDGRWREELWMTRNLGRALCNQDWRGRGRGSRERPASFVPSNSGLDRQQSKAHATMC